MIVRYEHLVVRRTCGSVRSSLSAPARLVTVGSEAAETTSLHRRDEERSARRFPRLQASVRSEGRLDAMPNISELLTGIVTSEEPKTLIGSGQNRHAVGCSNLSLEHTDIETAGVEAGAKAFVSLKSNIVNPTSRLLVLRQARPQGTLTGVAGRGDWRKQTPLCNGADRDGNIIPPCKRADFQLVVRDERTGRTFTGGNSK